ncbi:hypothetical protein TSOC_013667 [Tetrabaena socialis]|uniref:Peptidase M50 domain-containing protein n=1 Tax=Tetrabaena socialis TaxID=47790 RepID=A0A2J7ZJR4_9CHLO|nr:hypothetical protein TSOC_013667 [Tetrabaena socialis]|eukprot:PNH00507.1 hypothetical protein TSOC_013667 [Tetrabaena socialis]
MNWEGFANNRLTVPMGRIAGIPIRLHLIFLVVLALQLLGSLQYGLPQVLLWSILLGPVLLLTVLVHELGHCLAARSVGGQVDGVLLWPLGGLAFIGHTAGPKADMWVAVAGPLTHVPMVGIWLLLLLPAFHASTGSWAINLDMPWPSSGHLWHAVCVGAIIINLSLLAFNLLVPAYPLDGGRLLVDALLAAGVAPRLAAGITVGVAVPLGLLVLVYGILVFQMVTIMVAVFILFATFQLFQALRTDSLARHPLFAVACSDAAGGGAAAGPGGPYFKFESPSFGAAGAAGGGRSSAAV